MSTPVTLKSPVPVPLHVDRESILLRVCEVLDETGIAYCMLRSRETYTDQAGSDVDIIIDGHVKPRRLAALLLDHKDRIGADIVMRRGYCAILVGSDPRSIVTLDFASRCEAAGVILYDGALLLASRQRHGKTWVPAARYEFACELTRSIAKSRLDAGRIARLSALHLQDPAGSVREIGRFWRGAAHEMIVSAVRSGDWQRVYEKLDLVRSELLNRAIQRAPAQHLVCVCQRVADRVRRLWQPEGVTAVLLGTDGAGKSSVIEALPQQLADVLPHSMCWGFAPPLHRLIKRAPRRTDQPHLLPPRGRFASVARAAYWLAYAYLSRAALLVVLARPTLVMYDRHFVDILVDAKRYRYGGPDWLLRLIWRLFPKPDLIILLDAPAEVLQQRKQELPPHETARQRDAYLALVRSLSNGRVVDASASRENVAKATAQIVLRHLSARAAGSLRQR